jgi:beta-mannosidase
MYRKNKLDLGGKWRFRLDPDKLGEHYPEQLDIPWSFDARWMNLDHDEINWVEVQVPSCWQEVGYDFNGVAWYRKTFPAPTQLENGKRTWLHFEGVDYYSDIWVNEYYLGSHEGYFASFEYEISPYLNPEKNLIAVRVDSPNDISSRERQLGQLKGMIKGALQRWDVNNPEVNPGGIWNDVKLYVTGPGTIRALDIQTIIHQLPDPPQINQQVPASLCLNVSIDYGRGTIPVGLAKLIVQLRKRNHPDIIKEASVPIKILPGIFSWPVTIDLEGADLWYTWDLGEPNLYEVEITLELDGEISDQISQTFGFRKIERRAGWETYLNGIRFYQRGANYLSDQFLSSMDEARYLQDVELLREANLNTVHPFAVIEKQIFYNLCDSIGILVYQDFPMWLTMDNSSDLVRRAETQLKELIAQFHHHPSIGIWNFGSQPSVANFEKLGALLTKTSLELDPSRISHQANCMIDRHGREIDPVDSYKWERKRIRQFQEKYDWRVDTHQYYGWYWENLDSLKSVPLEDLTLVTEYGAQGLPSVEILQQIIPEHALYPPIWSYYTQRCFQPEMQFDFIPQPSSLEEMIQNSQRYQAHFIQYHTEYYRIHKFSPNNGAHYFCFNDCWSAITWSVIDYHREKKPGYLALQKAMAPLQVFLEFNESLEAGNDKRPNIWIVNDLIQDFDSLVLRWEIIETDQQISSQNGQLTCDVKANSRGHFGKLDFACDEPGKFQIELSLETGDQILITNSYKFGEGWVGY